MHDMKSLLARTRSQAVTLMALLFLMSCALLAREAAASGPEERENDTEGISMLWGAEERGTVSVSGAAHDRATPDIFILTLAVETNGITANQAVAENGVITDKMVAALRTLLGVGDEDSVQTSAYAVSPIYEYNREDKKSVLSGYRVTHQVMVRTGKTGLSGQIIDVAIANGANRVDAARFSLEENEEQCQRVLAIAVKRATMQAAFVARLLGAELGSVKSVVPSCSQDPPSPIYRQRIAEVSEATSHETVIEEGDIQVNAAVNIVFYLEQN